MPTAASALNSMTSVAEPVAVLTLTADEPVDAAVVVAAVVVAVVDAAAAVVVAAITDTDFVVVTSAVVEPGLVACNESEPASGLRYVSDAGLASSVPAACSVCAELDPADALPAADGAEPTAAENAAETGVPAVVEQAATPVKSTSIAIVKTCRRNATIT